MIYSVNVEKLLALLYHNNEIVMKSPRREENDILSEIDMM